MFRHSMLKSLLKTLEKIQFGTIRIELPNGQDEQFDGHLPGPSGHIRIHDLTVIRNAAIRGDIAFAEDYWLGRWNSHDLPALIQCAIMNGDVLGRFINGSKFREFLARMGYLLRLNTQRGSRKNIHAHYDLGNDFYALWLDKSMTYSSGIYQTESDDLYTAQMNKYDRILQRIGDAPRDILEIGCGWGGFAERSAQQSEHRINGITISDAQYQYALSRLQPFAKQARVNLQDYRDVKGKFDAIVSIEMFEAVGERYWNKYFDTLKRLLTKNGKAIIQTITIHDAHFAHYRKSGDAIRSYIFPGGMLPSAKKFISHAQNSGLSVTDQYQFGKDYARTLRCWLSKFDAQAQAIEAHNFDVTFQRLWRFYLASCIGAFEAGHTNVMQIELTHA